MTKSTFELIERQLAEAASQRESHKRQREHCKEQLADLEQMLNDARDRSASAIEKRLADILLEAKSQPESAALIPAVD
jgi:hypothetical protein